MQSPRPWSQRQSHPGSGRTPNSNVRPLLRAFFEARGYTAEEFEDFLNPKLDQLRSPFLIKNLEISAKRLAEAIYKQECVAIYGDYDIDGTAGLTLLETFLKACGLQQTICYQPDRFKEGYGVHKEAVKNLIDQGARLIVTVDTGITALAAAEAAKQQSVDLIITDHHTPLANLPDTAFIVNPNQTDDTSQMGHLCGTGVAFYLCLGLRSELRKNGYFHNRNIPEPDLRRWLDLYSIATIADCVPLVKENRVLTKFGLEHLRTCSRPGLASLLDKAFSKIDSTPSSRDISFLLAPKLNAASRMGQQQITRQLLLSNCFEESSKLVTKILELNNERTTVQNEITKQAIELAQKKIDDFNPEVLVLYGDWFEGVLGIVASKIMEIFGKPAIILGRVEGGTYRGSMRSPRNELNCVKLLEMSHDLLIRYGGHALAAGLSVERDLLAPFETRIHESALALLLSKESESAPFADPVFFDGILPSEVNLDDCLQLEKTAPWGVDNPPPLYLIENIPLAEAVPLKDQHLKWSLKRGPLMAFFRRKEIDAIKDSGFTNIDALVTPQVNRFRGSASVQFIMEHVRGTRV